MERAAKGALALTIHAELTAGMQPYIGDKKKENSDA